MVSSHGQAHGFSPSYVITDSIIKSIVSLNVNVEHMYKDIVQIHY